MITAIFIMLALAWLVCPIIYITDGPKPAEPDHPDNSSLLNWIHED